MSLKALHSFLAPLVFACLLLAGCEAPITDAITVKQIRNDSSERVFVVVQPLMDTSDGAWIPYDIISVELDGHRWSHESKTMTCNQNMTRFRILLTVWAGDDWGRERVKEAPHECDGAEVIFTIERDLDVTYSD